jgi:hypothetical protein
LAKDLVAVPNTSAAVDQSALTRAQFGQLAEVPPELEWLANITNSKTRRAYKIDVGEFSAFAGLQGPVELRVVTRAHVIAWRKDLERQQAFHPAWDIKDAQAGAGDSAVGSQGPPRSLGCGSPEKAPLWRPLLGTTLWFHTPALDSIGPRRLARRYEHRPNNDCQQQRSKPFVISLPRCLSIA